MMETKGLLPRIRKNPVRIRAGAGSAFQDAFGREWKSDTNYIGGEAVDRGLAVIVTAGTQELYHTVRVGASGYAFPAENGRYTVLLHMVENDPAVTGQGKRVFSVRVGDSELRDVDIWELSGGLHIPLVFAFAVTVRSGTLAVDFKPSVNAAVISALEILPGGARCQPAAARDGDLKVLDLSSFNGSDEMLKTGFPGHRWSSYITQSLERDSELPGTWAMRVDYLVDTIFDPNCVHRLGQPVDVSGYESFQFWAKPDGTGRKVFVRLHNDRGDSGGFSFRMNDTEPRLYKFSLSDIDAPKYRIQPAHWDQPIAPLSYDATSFGKLTAISFAINHSPKDLALGGGSLFFGDMVLSKEKVAPGKPRPRMNIRADGDRTIIEDFEDYATNDELWENWCETSHGNRAVTTLDHTWKFSGTTSMKLLYTFGKKDYSGTVIFPMIDLRDRNVFRVWVKPDGSGNRLEVFHAHGGLYHFLLPLDDTTPRMFEVPFRDFLGNHALLHGKLEIGFWVRRRGNSQGGCIWLDQVEAVYDPRYPLGPTAFPGPLPIPGDRITRINSGCFEDLVDESGNVWLSDRGYYWGVPNKDKFPESRRVDLPKTPHRCIYDTNRVGLDGYGFAVPNGEYIVRLHFLDWGGRLQGLSVNGQKQSDIEMKDTFTELVREIPVQVTDGRIHIEIFDKIWLCAVSGLEIVPVSLA